MKRIQIEGPTGFMSDSDYTVACGELQKGKTVFVVSNENCLAYLTSDIENGYFKISVLNVLSASIIKGYVGCPNFYPLSLCKEARLATLSDFSEYRVSSEGYLNDTDHYYIHQP